MGISYNPSIVSSGLVLALDAANSKSYPGSGTTWTDISGRGNTGTLTNGPTYSSANGGSLSFDGSDDFISIPSQFDAQAPLTGYGSFNGADTSAFTLEIWIKTTQISGTTAIDAPAVIGRDSSDIWANLTLYNGYIYYMHYNNAWLDNLKSTTMVSNGLWHQVVYVNNTNETGTIYIDGINEVSGSSSLSGTNYFSPDYIGRGYSGKYFQGNICACKFYDKSLSAAEVSQNYNALKSRFIQDGSSADRAAPSASYLVSLGITTNGFYYINLPTVGPTLVYCILDPAVDGGGWMVLWGAAQGATNYTYSFSASRDDISNSPINGFYSLSYAKRSAINALCTQNKTLVYAGSNSNWLRFDGYIWNSNSHTSGDFRFEFNSSLVTSNGTVDSSVEVGLTNYGVGSGGDFGIAINTDGLDHHITGGYYNLNNGCANMYLYQYAAGYKVNTGLSGWYNSTAGCTADNENDLPLIVAMK